MLLKVLQALLLVMTCGFALLAVELPDILHAVLALLGMSVSLGGLFWLLRAPYVAVFQLLVYAGAVVALFVIVVMLTGGEEREKIDLKGKIGVAGTLLSAIAVLLMSAMIWSHAFPLFGYARYEIKFVRASAATVGQSVSRFLWTSRTLELIAQAFLLLTAAVGCIALLRPGGKGGAKK